jgi:hypothetical protein
MFKKRILILLLLVSVSLIAAGCQKPVDSTALQEEIDALKDQVSALTTENEALKAQVGSSVNAEGLYDLRNTLDSQLYGALNALIRGDTATALESFTPSVTVKDSTLTSLYSKGTVEFLIPQRPMNLRQRAFWQDGDSFNAIYEIHDSGYDTPDERLNTLNVLYMRQDGVWRIDALFIDE